MGAIDEILDIPFKPWEYMTYNSARFIRRRRSRRMGKAVYYEAHYRVTFETLQNYNRSFWKPGDVVKFGDGLNWRGRNMWETWFLTGKEREDFIRRNRLKNKGIPVYARYQYAIILARYKWIKHKYINFSDYGSFVMMLTGEKAGHIRKYYVASPYEVIGKYPYTITNYNMDCEKLFHGVEIEDDVYIFLENLIRKLTNGN